MIQRCAYRQRRLCGTGDIFEVFLSGWVRMISKRGSRRGCCGTQKKKPYNPQTHYHPPLSPIKLNENNSFRPAWECGKLSHPAASPPAYTVARASFFNTELMARTTWPTFGRPGVW